MEIVFVRSKKEQGYLSYADFWRLAELSGFRVVPAPEADLQAEVLYVWPTLNMEFLSRLMTLPRGRRVSKVVWWYLERPDHNPGQMGMAPEALFKEAVTEALRWVDAVWVSDKTLAAIEPRARYAVLGSHEGLAECAPRRIRYDVAHLGQVTPRRHAVLDVLTRKGLTVTPNGWGKERAEALASSRLMLSIDRCDVLRLVAPLRWALAAAYKMPIVQEEVADPYPLESGKSVLQAPLAELASLAVLAIDLPELSEIGHRAHRTLCREWTFRRGVEEAVRAGAEKLGTSGALG